MESLCDLLFEVSNEDRLRLLRELRDREMNVTAIARAIEVTTQEVSRHLSRLTEAGLTEKDPDGPYRLTPFGVLALTQIQGLEFTSRHRRYFKNHTVDGLPQRFLLRMGELQETEYLDDVMVVIHTVEKIIKEADEYLLDLNVPYIASAFPHIRNTFIKGVKKSFLHGESLELSEEIMDERMESFDEEFKAKLSSSGLYEERILEVPWSCICPRRSSPFSPSPRGTPSSISMASHHLTRTRSGGVANYPSIIGRKVSRLISIESSIKV